ncbi:tRNA (cytosine-5-)-methyltransferase NSUN2 [Coprinopsis cinerea okayama7|uniref:tRNA (Cytosine-5-)-methyltransferase NSUN2 n=1 Tax=Coprinopsis cinerea (strain Okayama-7 / 130 / ATCC MYA-4618 / FGSC 9003) TaxID=240176 RepID=A8NFQ8_COPC7|nr:tRNA (cytosine-5-)-methyltransferase NSUN2 [Coprinopsis cinerea okayama7\|eukprot:XP_001833346.2 tRNA (cytosine-5-)-methyltransferase NSUN2 [Coprinopsis cinerea okayama7\
MGRRAKKQQGAPDLSDLESLITGKSLRKRKQMVGTCQRPSKKPKDSLKRSTSKSNKNKENGWEDVEDGVDFQMETENLFDDSDEGFVGDLNDLDDEFDDDVILRGPVQELQFSDDDEEGALHSDDSDEEITMANMEAKSRALDEEALREAELDAEELRRAALEADDDDFDDMDEDEEGEEGGEGEAFHLPTAEEREKEKAAGGPDLHTLQRRMPSYYGYNYYLAEKLFLLFPVAEAIEFFEANEVSRPVTIRTNTLRTRRRDLAQALINRGSSKVPSPSCATPEYLAGHYMLQAASSFLPVIALSPQPNERVLDMASAPGGKTTHMAALMQNTGVIFANDANKARTKSLTANVHRLGCKNVVVCSYDGREFPKVMGGFDRILLDAPCSGTGVISKDSSVKVNKSDRDFILLSHLQKQLILCAIDSVSPDSKTGGYFVYSTCSVTVEENEAVVDYALKKRPNVRLVDTGLSFGREGFTQYRGKTFHPSVKLTRRFYPHVHNMDGFYVAKFKVEKRQKLSNADKEEETSKPGIVKTGDDHTEDAGFDSEEDEKYIQEGKRKAIKAKGLKPPPRTSKSA